MPSLSRVLLVPLAVLGLLLVSVPIAEAAPKTPPPRTGYVPGKVAPDLGMVTAGGKSLKLSQLRGSYVVLDLSTFWCGPSSLAASDVRDAVSAINAPGALDAPLTWITAELEAQPGSAPRPDQLVSFAVTHGIGDLRSPVVSFGAVGSSTNLAAWAHLQQYDVQNDLSGAGTGAFPTFVVLDPDGVILDVIGGFTTDTNSPPSTRDKVEAAVGAQDVPYDLRPAPYTNPTFSDLNLDLTWEGATGSATLQRGLDNPDVPFGSLPLTAFYASSELEQRYTGVDLSFVFGMTRAEDGSSPPIPLSSTFEIQRQGVTWSSSPFKKLTPATSAPVRLVVASADGTNAAVVTTATRMSVDGGLGPITLQHLVDQAQAEIDGLAFDVQDVVAVEVPARWTGSIDSGFGMS